MTDRNQRKLTAALTCSLIIIAGLCLTRPALAKSGLIGRWGASKQIVRGKPVKIKRAVTWELKKGGVFVSTTTIPKRYPFKHEGSWRLTKAGKLVLTLDKRDRTFSYKLTKKGGLKLIERIGKNKQPRIYRMKRLRRSKPGK